jgi:hypothetical protein
MNMINRRFLAAIAMFGIWALASVSQLQSEYACQAVTAPIEQAVQAVSDSAQAGASLISFLPGSYK